MSGKVNPGQPLQIAARDWNRFIDKSNESPSGAGHTPFNPVPACMVRVVSSTPELPIAAGTIVAPIRVLYDRTDAENRRSPIIEVSLPFVNCMHPMMLFEPYSGQGRPALAVVSGCCWANVDVQDVSHRFANFGDVDGHALTSVDSGPVALLVGQDFDATGEQMVYCSFGVGERKTVQLKTYTYRCYGSTLIQTEHTYNVSGVGLSIEEV